jgi:hypothetical protein
MDAIRDKMKVPVLEETHTCGEVTEIEPDPRLMRCAEEHQDIPKGEAAVTPVKGLRKCGGSVI